MPCGCGKKKGVGNVSAPLFTTTIPAGGSTVVIAANSPVRLVTPTGQTVALLTGNTSTIYLLQAQDFITQGAPIWILQM